MRGCLSRSHLPVCVRSAPASDSGFHRQAPSQLQVASDLSVLWRTRRWRNLPARCALEIVKGYLVEQLMRR